MKISRSGTSLVRQSTNFATRLVMSILRGELLFKFRRVFSASSRLRLLISTWPAIFSASRRVLDEVDLQAVAEHLRHGLLDTLVGDGLFRLVLIGGLGGEGGNDNHQAVLHILEGDLALVLVVLAVLL